MPLYRFLRHVRGFFYCRHVDWTLKRGDLVVHDDWPSTVQIVDINWALMAAAVRVDLDYDAIVVWPLWNLRRYEA
jgi:hypothetical protein